MDLKRKLYSSGKWTKRAKLQKLRKPLCEICLSERGTLIKAKVSDHVKPVNWEGENPAWEFLHNPLQSLCYICHKEKTWLFDVPELIKREKTKMEFF